MSKVPVYIKINITSQVHQKISVGFKSKLSSTPEVYSFTRKYVQEVYPKGKIHVVYPKSKIHVQLFNIIALTYWVNVLHFTKSLGGIPNFLFLLSVVRLK